MSNILIATLPVQLACQLICAGNYSSDHSSIGVDNPVPKQTTVIPDGYTRFPDIGLAYKYYNTSRVTWNTARKACIADGGNLAVIDSWKKDSYIHGLIENSSDENIYLGIYNFSDDDEWISVKTGLSVAGIPWAPGSPISGQACYVLASTKNRTGITNVFDGESLYFVCEIPLN